MKIGQKTLEAKNTKVVTFYRGDEPISILVGPMPPKHLDRLRDKVLIAPEPPRKAVESRPGVYLYEGTGSNRKVIFQEDENDPAYREAWSKFYNQIVAAKVAAFVAHDPNFHFDVQKPATSYTDDPQAWRAYYTAVFEELTDEKSGFTEAELAHIAEAGASTGLNLGIEEAAKTF